MAVTNDFANELLDLVTDIVSADNVEFSQSIFQKTFMHEGLAATHEVITGVRSGGTIPIVLRTPNPDSFPFVSDANCDNADCDVPLEFSGKQWELGLIKCRVPICMNSFNENFLRYFNVWKNTHADESTDNALVNYIMEVFTQNLILSSWRAAWFGDKNSISSYYDGIDGFFVQAEAGGGTVIDITQNAQATYPLQLSTLTGEDVYEYLDQMYQEASTKAWFDPSILMYKVTKTMGAKLVAWLNQNADNGVGCECINPDNVAAGRRFTLNNVSFYGIPVHVEGAWDDIINYSAELNGGGGNNARTCPHRAILTYRENLLIGTNSMDSLEALKLWYSQDDDKIYMRGSAYIGASIPLDDYVLAACVSTT